jgi:hypothetical protein
VIITKPSASVIETLSLLDPGGGKGSGEGFAFVIWEKKGREVAWRLEVD